MLGLKRNVVELVDYNPEWKILANETMARLQSVFGTVAKDIQHIGSTAIVNIKAKPIIDIAVAINNFSEAEALYNELESNGFSYRNWFLHNEHIIFTLGEDIPPDDRITTHFIHIVKRDSSDWHNYIIFRDYLNAHYSVAKEYEALKEKMALENPYDVGREIYRTGKNDFVSQVLQKALVWSQQEHI